MGARRFGLECRRDRRLGEGTDDEDATRKRHGRQLALLTLLTLTLAGCPEPLSPISDDSNGDVGAGPRLPFEGEGEGEGEGDVDAWPGEGEGEGEGEAVDVEPAASDPGAPGPFAVGVRTVEVTDQGRERSFSVDVWYPVDPQNVDGSDNAYDIEMPLLGTVSSIESPARRNATPAAGARPLVVFSHGYGGVRFQSIFITEHLASHGFVVASPDHPGNTLGDAALLGSDQAAIQSSIDRPLDLALVLDGMLSDGLGTGIVVDGTRVGATGHSFGAWTALELARLDSRIGAVFPMAPGFRQGATPDFVADLGRPLLLIGGSLDDTCEFDENQLVPYQLAQQPKHLLQVVGAGHLDFSDLCQVPIARLFVDDGCNPDNIDPAVVHARVRTVATAFALHYIAGAPGYAGDLDVDAVVALGNVEFWSAP
jgi:predicted dienelactone hydrolase